MSSKDLYYIMRVAVTGSTGFIGKHVLAELAIHPAVKIVTVTRQRIHNLPELPQVRVVELDLKEASAHIFRQLGRPDVLIHLAWGGLPDFMSLHHFETELPMNYRFLQAMVKNGLQSLFVAGTCLEYGMQSGPLNETMETHPMTPYGFAKDVLRRQLEYLRADNPFSLVWARLFYLYGEGQGENSLLPQLQRAVEQGNRVFDMSAGEQLRDYLSVTDAAKYIVSLALKGKDIGLVNLCSGKPISVRRLAEKWVSENNWQIKLNLGHYPYPEYEPMAFWGDRSKMDHFVMSL